jgi:hypothetical protein
MINWSYFPKSDKATRLTLKVVEAFQAVASEIDSSTHTFRSNEVFAVVKPQLEQAGFRVEIGKRMTEKIRVPVLFGRNGRMEKAFEADA